MQLGTALHQLWRHKLGFFACIAAATFAAVFSIYKISLAPPGLHPRALEIAAASSQVLVDSPESQVLNLNTQANEFLNMTTRADLLSNVMASSTVRGFISRRAGIPVQDIAATAAIDENGPRAEFEPDSEKRASDLVSESDRYRVSIGVNPTLPVIYVNAQGPTPAGAERLANGAVAGLGDYLNVLADEQHVRPQYRTKLVPLAVAHGSTINPGVKMEVVVLTFLVVLALALVVLRVGLRVRAGWDHAGRREARDGRDWWLPKAEQPAE